MDFLGILFLLMLGATSPLVGQVPQDNGTFPCDPAMPGAGDWMIISERQSPPDVVVAAELLPGTMELLACSEAVFTDSGLDAVTESQWTLVLKAVIDAEGKVERFKIIHKPPIGTDLLEPTKQALRQWRYRPVVLEGKARPICLTLALPKPLGSKDSAACKAAKGSAEPSDRHGKRLGGPRRDPGPRLRTGGKAG